MDFYSIDDTVLEGLPFLERKEKRKILCTRHALRLKHKLFHQSVYPCRFLIKISCACIEMATSVATRVAVFSTLSVEYCTHMYQILIKLFFCEAIVS